jgi:hypothetical protein
MIKFCDEGYMFQYKILKAKQPFLYSVEKNEWTDFKKELLDLLNTGYELIHSDNLALENEFGDNESSFKIFILIKLIK